MKLLPLEYDANVIVIVAQRMSLRQRTQEVGSNVYRLRKSLRMRGCSRDRSVCFRGS